MISLLSLELLFWVITFLFNIIFFFKFVLSPQGRAVSLGFKYEIAQMYNYFFIHYSGLNQLTFGFDPFDLKMEVQMHKLKNIKELHFFSLYGGMN